MKHRNLLLSLLISGSFVCSIQNIESFKSIKTYAEESSEIVKYCGNTSNGNDLYIRKDDSFQLAGNKISVSKNGSIIDDTYLRDAESYTSYGGRLAISDGDSIEINFDDAGFNGCRQIESIATHFSSSGIKVNYFVKKNGESNYVDTEISTSTSFGNNQSFHSLSKLSNETIFSDIWSYGCVLFYLVTGVKPYNGLNDNMDIELQLSTTVSPIDYITDDNILDILYSKKNRPFLRIIDKCLRFREDTRPGVNMLFTEGIFFD